MKLNQVIKYSIFTVLLALLIGCSPETKIDYQLHKASVDMSKAFRQFQKADNAFYNGNENAAVNHLSKGLNLFQTSIDHLLKAEGDAYQAVSNDIDKGNSELQKSMDEYAKGNEDSAAKHYNKALEYYDKALDMLDE